MSRAKESALDALHAKVADVLTTALSGSGETAPSPQMISQAIKFLKDNGVDAPAKSRRVSNLAAALEELDLDEVANERRAH
ncbi:hypothetical protein [Novosphingobium meiothermophilum]|uniref:hypothetical protein n=1 Tax=Novosphingobium meiothermophilum TaxID=2202251 RepID=UPI0011AB35CB|nr:hypothetical protein [Novosphingobium meiothermophilum]